MAIAISKPKICYCCGELKTNFAVSRTKWSSKDGLQNWCGDCKREQKNSDPFLKEKKREYYLKNRERIREKQREWNRVNKEKAREHNLLYNYGITLKQFQEIFSQQGNRCAVCFSESSNGKYQQWHVDHDHVSGVVRGILCHSCNTGLGSLGDDARSVGTALAYILKSNNFQELYFGA